MSDYRPEVHGDTQAQKAALTQTLNVTPGVAYTVAALGTQATGVSLQVFIDNNLFTPGMAKLRDLKPGDGVIVAYNDGTSRHFQVTRVAAYAPQDAPIQDIFGNINGNYLNLITCAGDWIPSQHQTTLRLVVYTTLM